MPDNEIEAWTGKDEPKRKRPKEERVREIHFGSPARPPMDAILESATYTDKSGVKTIIYRTTEAAPKDKDGKTLFLSMPMYDLTKADLLGGPPPKSGRTLVIFHPDNYIKFSDLCASQGIALQEWQGRDDGQG